MARGWYGLEVGDAVEFKDISTTRKGIITYLFPGDKNRAVMMTEQGQNIHVVCEWCKKLNLN